ncbi:ferredoxin--nitrite reductase [Candidatus Poribacteria bacterium]|nr:ferredoxin--nitrite reductase [Candidatus Poribacteria bacterium]
MSQIIKKKPKTNGKIGRSKERIKIHPAELLKQKKNGLEVVEDIPHFIQNGWESIPTDERDRLKYVGVFYRRQTPGAFMMRLRMTSGRTNSEQFRVIAKISELQGPGYVDLTTRQQIQLRGFTIENVQTIWDQLEEVGLNSLQTGFDNIRGVTGCPVAGLTPNELLDASNIAKKYTDIIVGNKDFTDLPRKFNVGITGCLDNCTHAASQDIALIPALKEIDGVEQKGFNVMVGGKMGSGGFTPATDLDAFVSPDNAPKLCADITQIFRDNGSRNVRNKSRFAFLILDWGIDKFRQELETRYGTELYSAGKDMRGKKKTDHTGIFAQKQKGLNYVGLVVPVGRINTAQLLNVARIADVYGTGDIRLTQGQNIIIPNVPDEKIGDLTSETLLQELRYDPTEISRGMVSCTGMDYCHFSLIETKERAMEAINHLESKLDNVEPLTIHWSGCPNGCGNHMTADIGLLGKKTKVNGVVTDAVDVFLKGDSGPNPKTPPKLLENVTCDDLPKVLEGLVPYLSRR